MVIWSEPAKTDLRSIHDFIARNSKHYAKKVIQNIREKADILDKLPKMGRIVPEIGDEKVRIWLNITSRNSRSRSSSRSC